MERYSVIKEKNPREIILLRGRGCAYKKCSFCDYHTDSSADCRENFEINKAVLERVSGKYKNIEIINSGSVFELDGETLRLIKRVCKEKGITTVHFESHYIYKDRIARLRKDFGDFDIKMKLGLETFDYGFREKVLKKGIDEASPEIIAQGFDEANFLFGISGQTEAGMQKDIELGLKHFERICINIMCKNSTAVMPDTDVIEKFIKHLYPVYKDNDRVDILLSNTDFGVGD
ncbi:MAG: radical SAM protein [Eubacterium sp.]